MAPKVVRTELGDGYTAIDVLAATVDDDASFDTAVEASLDRAERAYRADEPPAGAPPPRSASGGGNDDDDRERAGSDERATAADPGDERAAEAPRRAAPPRGAGRR